MNFCVVTTINPPTKGIAVLNEIFADKLIIVGDLKTPKDWQYNNAQFVNPDTPLTNHYARKNIGYLEAMRQGATLIYDTDDDNIPNSYFYIRDNKITANNSLGEGWYNVYEPLAQTRKTERYRVWPRGFSLLHTNDRPRYDTASQYRSSIQQGLADGAPDVDAIYRLTINQVDKFTRKMSLYLSKGAWCPFNSQSTWWFPAAFPLMYLPATATFRMTDIWRSFVAQRCLWELGEGVTFHSPSEVYQERNPHDLIADFADEVPGYLNNDKIVDTLGNLKLKAGEDYVCDNLLACYYALVNGGFLDQSEIPMLQSWINEFNQIKQ